MVVVLFVVFLACIALRMPIAFSLGFSSFIYILFSDIPLSILPERMFSGIDSFVILCVPGFILAGNLMNVGGITDRIIHFCMALIGHVRGGLGLANVGSSMVFAGISGTAISDTVSIGSVMIPAMIKRGYDAEFSAAVTASSSTVGPIIPPSLPMVIAGTVTGLSVSRLFVAGIIPGLLLGFGLGIVSYLISVKRNHPKEDRLPFREVVRSFFSAFWAILMTLIILGGIMGGFFTPTEAAMIAVFYALIVGFFVYGELKLSALPKIVFDSAVTTASLMVLVGFANVFAWILTSEEIPLMVTQAMLSISSGPVGYIILVNILLVFVGMFMETIAALMILMPILLKPAIALGIDPIQFAIMCVLNLVIGLTTPPVGVCLFVASSIAKISVGRLSVALIPFIAVSLLVLLLVSFVPQVTLFLPNLVFNK
jgi:tripartite ATP-independent transporter DctM subunit